MNNELKDNILNKLRENENYISGEILSKSFGVTRAYICKVVKKLRSEGYNISSISNRGYKLNEIPDLITPSEIQHNLKTKTYGRYVHYFKEIPSTNNYAKSIADTSKDGTLIISEQQTNGRGRLGKEWVSNTKDGIYMSLIIKPKIQPSDMSIITLATALAISIALKKTFNLDVKIKWPNDIILNNKKVCGILTEMSSEIDKVNYLVLGIGVNVNQNEKEFSNELIKKAISIRQYLNSNKYISRSGLIRSILFEIENIINLLELEEKEKIIFQVKSYSATIGNEILIIKNGHPYKGKALDITDNGNLLVEYFDGGIQEIFSGEVSVKGLLEYI